MVTIQNVFRSGKPLNVLLLDEGAGTLCSTNDSSINGSFGKMQKACVKIE